MTSQAMYFTCVYLSQAEGSARVQLQHVLEPDDVGTVQARDAPPPHAHLPPRRHLVVPQRAHLRKQVSNHLSSFLLTIMKLHISLYLPTTSVDYTIILERFCEPTLNPPVNEK